MNLGSVKRLFPSGKAPASVLEERLRGERDMSVNRLAAGCFTLVYLLCVHQLSRVPAAVFAVSVAYVGVGLFIFANVRHRADRQFLSRYQVMLLDIGVLTFALAEVGRYMAPFYPMYLWVIVGNGFRFGLRYLWTASGLSVFGFAIVLLTSPFWATLPLLGSGLMLGLIIVPLYMGALLRRLSTKTDQLDTSNRAKAAILSSITHELRDPLRAAAALVDVLGGTHLDREQRALVQTVGDAASSVLAEIDDLLEVSRIEAQCMAVTPALFSLLDLVTEVVGLTRVVASAKGIQVAFHVTADTPLEIRSDRRHLRKILLSLAYNAVSFTQIGSVLLTASPCSGEDTPLRLRFEISDTGIGMPGEVQEEIFEAFSQGNAGILSTHGGSGLGLAVARHLVELLGGTISVRSSVGEGSTFCFEIPVEAYDLDAAISTDLTGVGVVILSREPPRVRPLAARLDRLGASSFVLDRADRLRAVLTEGADSVRCLVVLLDSQGVDATALAHVVRQEPVFAAVPFVLLAAIPGLPAVAVRQIFVTTITAASSDQEICSALRIAAPATVETTAAAETDAGPARETNRLVTMSPQGSARQMYVLVADGHRTTQLLLARMLEQAGHRVTVAGDGHQALDAVADRDFDVALLDLDLPEIDGIDTAKMIRLTSTGRRHLPLIGLTASSAPDATHSCLAASMEACLVKPVDRSRLLDTIASVMPAADVATDDGAVDATLTEPQGRAVTDIASHPHFRAGLGPPINEGTFSHVTAMGDPPFVAAVVQAFCAEATAIQGFLAAAVSSRDEVRFHGQLRELRAHAATIGAQRLEALCVSASRIGYASLPTEGVSLLDRLSREIVRVRDVLETLT